MKSILVIGAGGFGREVVMLINQINQLGGNWKLIGFLDDGFPKGEKIGDSFVLGPINLINQFIDCYFVIAIANYAIKKKILATINTSIKPATLIHPQALLGSRVIIGEGTIVCAGTIITEDVVIGNHVIINLCCTIGHDSEIESFCSVMPSVNISGEVRIGEGVFIGTGVKIINLVDIGDFSIIGAGAVVSKSLPSNCTAVGVPAKPIKYHG